MRISKFFVYSYTQQILYSWNFSPGENFQLFAPREKCISCDFFFFLSCVNDYIAPIVTFTTWVKINSMVMQRVGELVEIFVQWKFSVVRTVCGMHLMWMKMLHKISTQKKLWMKLMWITASHCSILQYIHVRSSAMADIFL